MNYQLQTAKAYSIYPGEYVPLYVTEMLLEKLSLLPGKVMKPIPLKILECDDCFKVDVSLPGVRREEIMVSVQDNTIHVAVLPLHDIEPVERELVLPEYIDQEFVTATFNLGILHIYLPKSTTPTGLNSHSVAVY